MSRPFFIVGPTASGKSEIAAAVAARNNAEVVGADAYQIYAGLNLLTAQPSTATLGQVPHHLIGTVGLTCEMSAARYRELALSAFGEIRQRGKNIIVCGGSGLYVRALAEGFSSLPQADAALRARLAELSLGELNVRLRQLDPGTAAKIDAANPRRVQRALEICLLSGRPASALRTGPPAEQPVGVFLMRNREDLYDRINRRVTQMFADGVVEEVRAAGTPGATAGQTLGLREIRQLLACELSEAECIAAIQQGTRRYAKRQLTWFRRQSNFEPLNLSERTTAEVIELITQKARLSFAHD